jgi:murein L,D-transpeptidase YafK
VAAAMIPAPQPSAIAVAPATPIAPASSGASAVSGAGLQTAALIAPGKHDDPTAAGRQVFDQTPYDSRDDPASWSLHIYKSRHRTEVFFKGRLFRIYHAVFGRSRWGGAKLWEGDSRTPEGAYLITEKRRSARFRWFLKLNYPNATDQEHFAALRSAREISAGAREGGQVGIHGTDSPYLNVSDVNWTLGCISVANEDIAEMATLLPVGTLVVINP